MCSRVPPAPVYKGGEGEAGRPSRACQKEGVLLGLQVLVGFHLEERGKKEGRGGREGKGGAAPSPRPIRTQKAGARDQPLVALPLSPLRPIKAH